jgi:hypothetical protein
MNKPLREKSKEPFFLKYKNPVNAVENLEQGMDKLNDTSYLGEKVIEQIRENVEWLMDEHSSTFGDGKIETVRRGLDNLEEDQKTKTAYGVLKIVKRELEMEGNQ